MTWQALMIQRERDEKSKRERFDKICQVGGIAGDKEGEKKKKRGVDREREKVRRGKMNKLRE